MAYPAARVQRTLPFPRERVFRAFLDPDTMVRWFVDPSFTDGRAEVDERVGGHYRIFQVDPAGDMTGGSENRILELVPNERIVLAWQFAGPNRDEDLSPSTRLTVTFAEPRPGETELTVVHEQLDELAAAMPVVAGDVEAGWNDTLDRLTPVLS
ncbi:MAG: SRPBCC domain-containing protein [Lapillicoccus sp.]